jgi:molybdopterin-guanine dinucleotide biosynthesis protein A
MRTGLILAGGNSSRFGSWKAMARFRGRPMVGWVADVLRSETDELLVSVGSHEQADRLHAVIPEAETVLDLRHDRGPIEGFARGFEVARGNVVLVAPCDAPLLRVGLYRLLLEALGDHEAAVPRVQALDPLRAVYRTDAVRRALAERSPPCPSALVDVLRSILVDADDLRKADPSLASFVDANRVADLRHALRLTSAPRAEGAARGVKTPIGASLHTVATEPY